MATVKLNQSEHARQFGNNPWGNVTSLLFTLRTDATGAAINSDSTDPVDIADVVDLGPLPEGLRLEDASIFVTTAMTGSVTGSLGFKYEDGEDSTEVPQDAAYFGSGLSLAATARVRATGAGKLVTLPKPARLILTTAGAKNVKASEVKVLVQGELTGPR